AVESATTHWSFEPTAIRPSTVLNPHRSPLVVRGEFVPVTSVLHWTAPVVVMPVTLSVPEQAPGMTEVRAPAGGVTTAPPVPGITT
ncbi:hypothetical protein LCGC14_2066030, partial [marine sediment metagenome]